MIRLPDGAQIEMAWKHVKYIRNNDFIVFQVVPMLEGRDVIIVPNREKWKEIAGIFSYEEREEIIFLLERIAWKREVRVVELDIPAKINEEIRIVEGTLEATQGYKTLTGDYLFDVNGVMTKEQVKAIYLALERKYAENMEGTVRIPRELLIPHSVMKEYILPILEKKKDVCLEII